MLSQTVLVQLVLKRKLIKKNLMSIVLASRNESSRERAYHRVHLKAKSCNLVWFFGVFLYLLFFKKVTFSDIYCSSFLGTQLSFVLLLNILTYTAPFQFGSPSCENKTRLIQRRKISV